MSASGNNVLSDDRSQGGSSFFSEIFNALGQGIGNTIRGISSELPPNIIAGVNERLFGSDNTTPFRLYGYPSYYNTAYGAVGGVGGIAPGDYYFGGLTGTQLALIGGVGLLVLVLLVK